MDTQPLLRVNNVKPQNSQSTAVRNNDSTEFDQHLQEQIQQADTTETPANHNLRGNTDTSAQNAKAAKPEQQETDSADENTEGDGLAVASDVTTALASDAEIAVNLDAILASSTQQDLPPDGNALPLLLADFNNQNLPQDATALPMIVAGAVAGDEVGKPEHPLDVADMLQLTEPESAPQALNNHELLAENSTFEHVQLPVQLTGKSSEVMSDKQLAALIADANKTPSVSMQQVVGITGSAAANIQTYVPPQFDAVQTVATGFNGSINTPVNHPAWGSQVGDQLAFMIQGKIHSAEIKLNPAHLGPLEIHLSLKDDQASVMFVSAHAPVREALDAALPRLRDMLEQQGLNLANVDVSAHSGGQREAFGQQNHPSHLALSEDQQDQSASSATVLNTRIETGLSVFV